MKLIKNIEVYSPDYLGKKDVLLAGKMIHSIKDHIEISGVEVEVIDGTGKVLLPGFIDNHVHILGGGGEGGYRTRTPELSLSTAIQAGVTTVVGCIGTDGVTRQMESLIAKAKGLKEEGISCYVYTGSYDVPVRTLLPDIRSDMILLEEVIGVGEIALSDHRSSFPTKQELTRIVADARVGGMLSNKAGVVNIHLGDAPDMINMILDIAKTTPLPLKHFLPTHVNRNPELFAQCIEFAKQGGNVDLTTSTTPLFLEEGETKCSIALKQMLDQGVAIERITFSSDGQGSLPVFDPVSGRLKGLKIGLMDSLFAEVVDAVKEEGVPLESAVKLITSNCATTLKLPMKGFVKEGFDADLVLADAGSLAIDTVIALGQVMMQNKKLLVKGTFEDME